MTKGGVSGLQTPNDAVRGRVIGRPDHHCRTPPRTTTQHINGANVVGVCDTFGRLKLYIERPPSYRLPDQHGSAPTQTPLIQSITGALLLLSVRENRLTQAFPYVTANPQIPFCLIVERNPEIMHEITAQPAWPPTKISQVLRSRDAKTENRFVWSQITHIHHWTISFTCARGNRLTQPFLRSRRYVFCLI